MEEKSSAYSANAVQAARAARLRELIEPWSLRKLEVRTGIGRTALDQRLKGKTPLTMPDIEVLAPVIRMTPQELFAELLAVDPKNPLQETFRSLAPVTQLVPRRAIHEHDKLATVTEIRAAK